MSITQRLARAARIKARTLGLAGAAALALGLGLPGAASEARAAPLGVQVGIGSDATPVHYRGRHHRHGVRKGYHPGYDYGPRHYRRHRRSGVNVQLNFGTAYRVDPYGRVLPRYRSAPHVARPFATRTPVRRYRNYGARHHAWCDGRYRSYRSSDGTFQPYNGPRRRCNSPYDGI